MNIFLCISMVQTQDPLGWVKFELETFISTNEMKDNQAMLYTKFQASLIFFYVFLWFKLGTPRGGAILDPGTFI